MNMQRRAIWGMMVVGTMLAGCVLEEGTGEDSEDVGSAEQKILSENGLDSVNGIDSVNGLDSVNGFHAYAALSSTSGLANGWGLMTTPEGRKTLEYIVRCALPQYHTINKLDQNYNEYTFYGGLGLAPEWETGACSDNCQQAVSACVVAHLNTAGLHVPIWLVGAPGHPYMKRFGADLSPNYPKQEGSFFGNVFKSPPRMYYCNGRDFGVNQVPGRIGAGVTGPYTNPFTLNSGRCDQNCYAIDGAPNAGYKACFSYNAVATVWLQ